MYKVGRSVGLQMIRENGLESFPDINADYYLMDGGVIACKPFQLGGNELHIAFTDKSKVRSECERFCDFFGGTWWAIIRKENKSVINCAKKIGFTVDREITSSSIVDMISRDYTLLKRG